MGAVVHVDVDFTALEREIIDEAARQLRLQAGIEVTVKYDLDYENLERLFGLAKEKKLSRTSTLTLMTARVDEQVGGRAFGFTYFDRDMWIVWDRMRSRELMLHVCIHELLHGFGVPHTKDPKGVMYENTDSQHMATVLAESDREAIRRAAH